MEVGMTGDFEIIDCGFEVLPASETTLIKYYNRVVDRFTSCFHDGAPMDETKEKITYKNISFCSRRCLFSHFDVCEFPSIIAELPDLLEIEQAPRREELKRYGGSLSLSRFRNSTLTKYQIDDESGDTEQLCCLHDCGTIDGTIVTFEKYFGRATFCSWSCCLAHLMTIGLAGTKLETEILMRQRGQFIPAPPRLMLIQFGGSLSLENFRKFSQRSIFLLQYPLKTRLYDGKISENGEFFLEMSLTARKKNISKTHNNCEMVETTIDIHQNARLKTTFLQNLMKNPKSDFYIYPSDESMDSNKVEVVKAPLSGKNFKKNSTQIQLSHTKSSVSLPFFKKK